MIKPYTAVGLIPTVRGIRKRKDIGTNLEHLSHLVKAASWLSSLDLPVRLIAFPEGALQGGPKLVQRPASEGQAFVVCLNHGHRPVARVRSPGALAEAVRPRR